MIELGSALATLRERADCRRRQVGALLVQDREIVGRGWNGLPDGSCLGGECPRGLLSYDQVPASSSYAGNCQAVHAEVAAIRDAGSQAFGSTCYVTAVPCPGCATALDEAGVRMVVLVSTVPSGPAAP